MATLRNRRKLEALNKDNPEELPRSNQARDAKVPRSQEDCFTVVSEEEIEGRVTKKLSHEFSRFESLILGALYRLVEFLLNPLIQGLSGSVPETSRNTYGENQGNKEDHSPKDPHREVRVS